MKKFITNHKKKLIAISTFLLFFFVVYLTYYLSYDSGYDEGYKIGHSDGFKKGKIDRDRRNGEYFDEFDELENDFYEEEQKLLENSGF